MQPLTLRRLRPLLAICLLLSLFLASLILYAHFLIQKPSVQKTLVEQLSRLTGYRIETGPIELNLWGGIGFTARSFQAVRREGTGRVRAEALRVHLSPGALLRGRVIPVNLVLDRPRIALELPGEGDSAVALRDLPLPWVEGLLSLSIEDGTILVTNRPYDVEAVHLEVRAGKGDPRSLDLVSSGRLLYRREKVPFRARGTASRPSMNEGPFRLWLELERVPMTWVPWPDDLRFQGGRGNGILTVEGVPGEPVSVEGSLSLKDLDFALVQSDQRKTYGPPEIRIAFKAAVENSRLRAPGITLHCGDLSLRVDLEVDLTGEGSPRLDMRVESDPMRFPLFARYFPTPLLAPWVENRLFPLLQEGVVRLEHLALQGTLDEIENLDLPVNAGALSMAVACREFRVAGSSLPTPFQDVSARVVYGEGTLRILDLKGRLDGSTVRECRIDIANILEDRPLWSILVDGDFELPTLMKQRGIDFLPPDALRKLNRIGPVTGLLSCRARFRYEPGWEFPRTREGLFVLRDCVVRQPELVLPLTLSHAEVRVSQSEENRFLATGAWGASRFEANGTFGEGTRAFPVESAEVSTLMDMNEALPVLLKGFELPLAFEAPVLTRFSLARDQERWACKGRIELKGVTLRNDRVSMNPPGDEDHIDFDLQVGPGGHLALNEVRCLLRGSELELSGGYDLERKDLFTAEIATGALDLEDLGLRFHDRGRTTRGFLQGKLKVISSRKDPFSTMILGRVEGRDVSAQVDRLPSEITNASFSLDFSGKTISITSCRMRVGRSEMDVEGEIQGWRGVHGQLRIGAQFLDPADFLKDSDEEGSPVQGLPETLKLRLEIHGDNAQWRGLRFGPLRAEVLLRDGEVRLIRSRVRLKHGVLTTSGYLRNAPAPQVYLSNHVRLTGQPVPELLDGLDMENPFLKGTLDMVAYLTLQGRSLKGLLPSLSGNVDVVIRDGVIRKSSVFVRVLDLLSLQKVLKGKPADLPDGTLYFEEMKGFGVIDRGIIATENFSMTSPVYNAVAAGKADLVEKTVAFALGVQPLETLDVLVSKIPILGYALTGKDRSLLVYYFEVNGPMTDPSMRYVPFKHLGSGVAGVLKRLFLSPLRLYDQISGSTEPPSSSKAGPAP